MGDVVAGRFELIDLLGSGGAGSVWRAWDHKQGCYLAAKVLKHSDSDSIMRFIREARTIIEHEHVLVPRNWVGEDDRVLFTTDLVRGGSVAALVSAHGALPERWVLEVGRQTAKALASIHAQGLVHRDVKPANLLLEPTGRNKPHVWLADFGIATTQDAARLTATHLVLGTPGYLPLEAYHGALPAPSQDMWALGAVLRHLATAQTPPPAPEADAWRDAGDQWPLSPGLAHLVTDLLNSAPEQRPTAAQVVARIEHLLLSAPAEGDHIEVFDQVGLPPAGWGPGGPLGLTGPAAAGHHAASGVPSGPHTHGIRDPGARPGDAATSGGHSGGQPLTPVPTRFGTTGHRTRASSGPVMAQEDRTIAVAIPVLLILLGVALVALSVLTW